MASIKSRDTRPELLVRRIAYSLGYRYRIGDSKLVGKPDLVFKSRHKVIFVHGCFWHVHEGCSISHIPDSDFWRKKLTRNQERDKRVIATLEAQGWDCLVLWECELGTPRKLANRLRNFLG